MQKLKTYISLILTLFGLTPSIVQAEPRMALLIGNGAGYSKVDINNNLMGPLDEPENDVDLMREALIENGFTMQNDLVLKNATRMQIITAVRNFVAQVNAHPETTALFYYAGHGVQGVDPLQGTQNYLIPVKDTFVTNGDVIDRAVSAQWILGELTQDERKGVTIMLLDACRNSMPLRSSGRGEALPSGFTQMSASGAVVGFAAASGQRAFGETGNGHGLYTKYFVQSLRKYAHLPLSSVFEQTASLVAQQSVALGFKLQTPWYNSGLRAKDGQFFCLSQCQFGASVPEPEIVAPPTITQPQLVQLTVRSNIKRGQDQVMIDGENKGATKIIAELEPGIHQVQVTAAGYKTWEKEIELTQPYAVYAKLEPVVAMVTEPPSLVAKPASQLISGRYQDNGNGTVTDTTTNLMWKRCSEGQSWTGNTCKGIYSSVTWNEAMPHNKQKSWDTFAGHRDWRLPTFEELHTLVYCSSGTPKDWNNTEDMCSGDFQRPVIDHAIFPYTPTDWFWSASASTNDFNFSWIIFFGDGEVSSNIRPGSSAVRLVRSGQ